MEKQYYDIHQCSYCGRKESGPVSTPEGWFGVDEEGDKVCDDCREAIEALESSKSLKLRQIASAKKTNKMLKKNNPNHYREAALKRWKK